MWGIFGKPLKRAIRNSLGLHAVLTKCLRFSSVLADACVAFCLYFCQAATTSTAYKFTPRAVASPDCTTETIGSEKSTLSWGKLGAGYSSEVP